MNSSSWDEIADFVLKHDFCFGCSVCAGVRPNSALEMRFNEHEEYRPYLIGKCKNSGLCSNACPFVEGHANEDELSRINVLGIPNIRQMAKTGYYLDTYAVHVADPQVRWNRTLGGGNVVIRNIDCGKGCRSCSVCLTEL